MASRNSKKGHQHTRVPKVSGTLKKSNADLQQQTNFNSVEEKKHVLDQLKDMFQEVVDIDVINSVAENCSYNRHASVEALMMISNDVEISRRSPATAHHPHAREIYVPEIPLQGSKPSWVNLSRGIHVQELPTKHPPKALGARNKQIMPEFQMKTKKKEKSPPFSGISYHSPSTTGERNQVSRGAIKVSYRCPNNMEESDSDADVVIEEEKEYDMASGSSFSLSDTPYPSLPQFLTPMISLQGRSENISSLKTRKQPSVSESQIQTIRQSPNAKFAPNNKTSTHMLQSKSKKTLPSSEQVQKYILESTRVMVLMRGAPGSGKSYLAKKILQLTMGKNVDCGKYIFSTDEFFVLLGRFIASMLPEAHTWNKKRVQEAAERKSSPIFVDNTNTEVWEMEPYAVMAVQHGYILQLLEPSTPWRYQASKLVQKNVHGVQRQQIHNMLTRFEKNLTGNKLISMLGLHYSSSNKPPQPAASKPNINPKRKQLQSSASDVADTSTKKKRTRKRKKPSKQILSQSQNCQETNNSHSYAPQLDDARKMMDTLTIFLAEKYLEEHKELDPTVANSQLNSGALVKDVIRSNKENIIPTESLSVGTSAGLDVMLHVRAMSKESIDNIGSSSHNESEKLIVDDDTIDDSTSEDDDDDDEEDEEEEEENGEEIGDVPEWIVSDEEWEYQSDHSDEPSDKVNHHEQKLDNTQQCWEYILVSADSKWIYQRDHSEENTEELLIDLTNDLDLSKDLDGKFLPSVDNTFQKEKDLQESDTRKHPQYCTEIFTDCGDLLGTLIPKQSESANSDFMLPNIPDDKQSSISADFSLEELVHWLHEMDPHLEPTKEICPTESTKKLIHYSELENQECKLYKEISNEISSVAEDDAHKPSTIMYADGRHIEETDYKTELATESAIINDEHLSSEIDGIEDNSLGLISPINNGQKLLESTLIQVDNEREFDLHSTLQAVRSETLVEIESNKSDPIDVETVLAQEKSDLICDKTAQQNESQMFHGQPLTSELITVEQHDQRLVNTDVNYIFALDGGNAEILTDSQNHSDNATNTNALAHQHAITEGKNIDGLPQKGTDKDNYAADVGMEEENTVKERDLQLSTKMTTLCNLTPWALTGNEQKNPVDEWEEKPKEIEKQNSSTPLPARDQRSPRRNLRPPKQTSEKSDEELQQQELQVWDTVAEPISTWETKNKEPENANKESDVPQPQRSIFSSLIDENSSFNFLTLLPDSSENSFNHQQKQISEASNEVSLQPKIDSSTNTHYQDFALTIQLNQTNGTPEVVENVKILIANNNPINESTMPIRVNDHMPYKPKLDKSSMTNDDEDDIATAIQVSAREVDIAKSHDFDRLRTMFPHLSEDDLKEIFEKCYYDLNWTIDLLLESKLEHFEQQAIRVPSQNEVPQKNETEASVHEVPISSEEEQGEAVKKVWHEEVKKYLEGSVVMSDESYPKHTLQIKKLRHTAAADRMDTNQVAISSHQSDDEAAGSSVVEAEPKALDDESESTTSSSYDEEEMLPVTLEPVFINQLHEKFGNPFPYYEEMQSAINLPLSLARQIHYYVVEAQLAQLEQQHKQMEQMIQKDEELARKLQEEEHTGESNMLVPDLQEIMDMEMALALYRADQRREQDSQEDLATKMRKQKLFEMFPNLDKGVILEVFSSLNNSFDNTAEAIVASMGADQDSVINVVAPEAYAKLKEEVRQEKSKAMQKGADVLLPDVEKYVKSQMSQEDALHAAEEYRCQARSIYNLHRELFKKAKEASENGLTDVAAVYSKLAGLHEQSMQETNAKAAAMLLRANASQKDDLTLDLHYLHVSEAVEALDIFLDYHIAHLVPSHGKKDLYLITGRGLRSVNGKSRLRPAVEQRLKQRNIKWHIENPGLLRVVITRSTALSCSKQIN